jgi:hypothetical protein
MRGLFFLSVLTFVSARPGSNPFLSPAPISAVQPIVNDSAEFTGLFNYAPKAPAYLSPVSALSQKKIYSHSIGQYHAQTKPRQPRSAA